MRKAANIRRRHHPAGPARQAGATALEFALVFPVFFMLFYGILSFGFIGLARMSLQHAAEEGARSALAWQADDGTRNEGEESALEYQLRLRREHAGLVACDRLLWLTRVGGAGCEVVVEICGDGLEPCGPAAGDCDIATQERCQLVVDARYAYGVAPILPALPGFGVVVPANLRAQARVMISRRAL